MSSDLASTGAELPRQRVGNRRPTGTRIETGGAALVASTFSPKIGLDDVRILPRPPRLAVRVLPRWLAVFRTSAQARGIASDVAALLLAVLDVWLVIPEKAATYSIWLSAIAVAAMVMRRYVPFLAVLVTVPGYLTGWSQLAAMIALGSLAKKHRLLSWRMVVGSILVFICGYIRWPLSEFTALSWQEHALNVIWAVIIAASWDQPVRNPGTVTSTARNGTWRRMTMAATATADSQNE